MSGSIVTPEDRANAQNMIEMAALYLEDGAFFTALDLLRDATKIVEALAVERQAMLDQVPEVAE